MSIQAYDLLAPVYDAWQHHAGARPLWRFALGRLESALLDRPRASVASYIDFACGTGGLLLELRRRRPGWRLVGVDGSPAMLQQARGRNGADGIDWRLARFGQPTFHNAFDGAGCLADALNHLDSLAELNDAVAAMAVALRPGGRLAFDVTNLRGFQLWWRGRRTTSLSQGVLTLDHQFEPDTRRAWADITLQACDGTQRSARVQQRWFDDAEVTSAVEGAGLRLIQYEAWAPFDAGSPGKTWVVAEKPGDAAPPTPPPGIR